MKEIISTEKAPKALGAYSQGVSLSGFVFTSGQLPIDPATGELSTGDIASQTEQAMRNLKAVVEQAGLTMDDILKVTILLADIADFTAVNQAYESFFTGNYPARTCYAVKDIPKGARLEIEAIAGRSCC